MPDKDYHQENNHSIYCECLKCFTEEPPKEEKWGAKTDVNGLINHIGKPTPDNTPSQEEKVRFDVDGEITEIPISQVRGVIDSLKPTPSQPIDPTLRKKFENAYYSFHSRCDDPKNVSYKRYGGRGISYEWNTLEEFRNDMWDSFVQHVKEHGKGNTSLDRIDGDKNYCKENCRWATKEIQQNNTVSVVNLTMDGETKSVSKWAKQYGVKIRTVFDRLASGWTPEEAVKTKTAIHRGRTWRTQKVCEVEGCTKLGMGRGIKYGFKIYDRFCSLHRKEASLKQKLLAKKK